MMKARLVMSMFMSAAFCAPVMSGEQDCMADGNDDGIVNVDDLLEVMSHWGPCDVPCPGDVNGSGNGDVSDLAKKLTLALENVDLYRSLEETKKFICSQFSTDSVANAAESVYKEIAEAKH